MGSALAKLEAVDIDGLTLNLTLYVAFGGAEIVGGFGTFATINVVVLGNDTPDMLRQKMSTAVRGAATSLGFVVTAAEMTLPAFTKG